MNWRLTEVSVLVLVVSSGCSESPGDADCTGDQCGDAYDLDADDIRPARDLPGTTDGAGDGLEEGGELDLVAACEIGESRCTADGRLETCLGGLWTSSECPLETACVGGECLDVICEPGVDTDCDEDGSLLTCNETGTGYDRESCPAHWFCQDGACVEGCGEPRRYCIENEVWECTAEGEDTFVEGCDVELGEQCIEGECLDRCEVSEFKRDYIGCEFLAADLPNDSSALDNIFAFAFSNPWDGEEATVTITYPTGRVEAVTVPPLSLATHELPVPRMLMVRGSGIFHRGFHIESTIPVTSFMFNPLEQYDPSGAAVATNDASLLIPTPIIGTEYLAMTWSDPAQYSGPPYVTVVALTDDTEVHLTPTETIVLVSAPYLAPARSETTFTLDAMDVLNIEATGGDLTGTLVTSSDPVAVFSGNTCARVPDEGRFCDHIETQLPPVETWGNEFVATKFTDRGGEADYFRILALQDGTRLTFDPPRANVPTLSRGTFYQFESTDHFSVSSRQPFLLGQFMASENMTSPDGPFGESDYCPYEIGGSCWGDPSLVLVPPVEQLRADYIYLVPDTYRYNFINIAFAEGTTVTIDDEALDLSGAQPVGSSGGYAITKTAEPGYHSLIGSAPMAVIVYGFDHNISYAYEAGLDFRVLLDTP